ncbi:hypothetical protein ACQ4PT_058953 [Festuca glaucescens]
MSSQVINAFPSLTAAAAARYPSRPAGGPGVHSALTAGGRSALTSGRHAKHSLAVRASSFGPRNKAFHHLPGNCTAERGIPLLLNRAEDEERIASSVLELVGWTPMVELKNMADGCGARIVAKLEYYQPLCSIKDRPSVRLIEDAEENGLIKPGVTTLVEMTSGNTGIGLAYVAALKGYKFIAIMPAGYSIEKQTLLVYLGAKVVLCDPALGNRGFGLKLKELRKIDPTIHFLDQFNNPANLDAHIQSTGPEIWRDTAGKVDILVAASGTGGTVSGIGRYLKAQNPAVKVICVEPAESRVLSGYAPGPHKIQGIGPDTVPKNLDRSVIDEIVSVSSDDAIKHARRLANEEGLLVGISSGANVAACLEVAARDENAGKMVVTVFPSGGERYLSTDLFEEARREAEALVLT